MVWVTEAVSSGGGESAADGGKQGPSWLDDSDRSEQLTMVIKDI